MVGWWQRLRPVQWAAIGLGVLAVLLVGILVWQGRPVQVASQGNYAPFDSKEAYDAFYQEHPILLESSPKDALFTVTSSITRQQTLLFEITLFEPAIRPGDPASEERYIATLEAQAEDAKRWLKEHGEDPEQAAILWRPDPYQFRPTTTPTPPPLPQRDYLEHHD